MSCDQIEVLLSLYRPGEITPEEEQLLDAHLRICPDCARRRGSAISTGEAIRRVRATPLPHSDVENAVTGILAKIQPSGSPVREHLRVLRTGILDVAERPFFRLAAGLAAILLVGAFAIQQLMILNDVSQLQDQLAHYRAPALSIEARYIFRPPLASLAPEVRHLIDIVQRHIVLDPTGRITAPVSAALEFRTSMEEGLPGTSGGAIRPLVRRMLRTQSERIDLARTEVFVSVPSKGEVR